MIRGCDINSVFVFYRGPLRASNLFERIQLPWLLTELHFGSLGTMTLRLCQRDSSFHSELFFDSEIRLAFENRFYSERVVVQSCPDLNDDAYSDYPELNESLFQSCNLNWVTV